MSVEPGTVKKGMTVDALARWLDGQDVSTYSAVIPILAADGRQGVRRLLERARVRLEAWEEELRRLARMTRFEKQALAGGAKVVAGVDEAGCGPLAGPVVAAAVVLPEGTLIPGLDDSKKLSPEKREQLYTQITARASAIGVGVVDPARIDEINIRQAAFEAMRRAIAEVKTPPVPESDPAFKGPVDHVLVDGFRIPLLDLPQTPIIGGDGLSLSIAAASIIAKVTRDRIMSEFDRVYPQYGFARHKGYGTEEHVAALRLHGPSPIHRRSFSWDGR
ncbi:MAG: ribonuclease HII [Actinobacteria bacterium]|nr:ribonuclease HII [Actinomycetota bacterium]